MKIHRYLKQSRNLWKTQTRRRAGTRFRGGSGLNIIKGCRRRRLLRSFTLRASEVPPGHPAGQHAERLLRLRPLTSLCADSPLTAKNRLAGREGASRSAL